MNTKNVTKATTRAFCAATTIALALSTSNTFAAASASDNAGNYGGGWSSSPPNLGTGFGAWNIQLQNAYNPPYVGTYPDNIGYGSYGDNITTAGWSWATYANQGGDNGEITMNRPFTAGPSGSASLYDQTFSMAMSSGGVGNGNGGPPNAEMGISIGNAFSFDYLGTSASDNMYLSVDGGPAVAVPIGFGALNGGLDVSLSVSGALNSTAENYTFSVSPAAGGPALYSTTGTFNSAAYNTASVTMLDENTTGNNYFNSLNITPENPPRNAPDGGSTVMLLGSGVAALAACKRRFNSRG